MVRKILTAVFVIIAAICLSIFINAYRTKQKLATYCRETAAGSTLDSARQKAEKNGFRFIDSSSVDGNLSTALVTADAVMGRVACEIEHNGNRVVRASLHRND